MSQLRLYLGTIIDPQDLHVRSQTIEKFPNKITALRGFEVLIKVSFHLDQDKFLIHIVIFIPNK